MEASVVGGRGQAGGHQERAQFVAVQTHVVGLEVEAGRRTCTAGECSMRPSSAASR